ncbi:MAG TPA: peptidase S10 [Rhodanobacteraceae bacterium]|jgi:carboxypeptidase C (cathepsin A)|nr:peptidase S10 [Rhodanobacteraceae bacterium]
MKANRLSVALATLLLCSAPVFAAPPASASSSAQSSASNGDQSESLIQKLSKPLASTTTGTVTVEGKSISYKAVAGTLVLDGTGVNEGTPQVAMSYVAYFKQGADPSKRPVTFIYNGGPGSSTVWLHMGAWGPQRIVTNDDTHTPAAPYQLVNNDYSLLDASDLVFIDMPGTGFGRLLSQGKDEAAREKSHKALAKDYWGIDGDAQAFSRFITQFLSKYDRWNSPKFLFGESYGTTRSAVLANMLQTRYNVGLNGVMLLSQILNFSLSIDGADMNPGLDMSYVLALPTYAATAWYHRKLPKYTGGLAPLLAEATKWATTDYEQALAAGSTLSDAKKQQVAQKLSGFTGLPVAYLLKANLRVTGGMFEQQLLSGTDSDTGRLDTRFSGPSMDPLAKTTAYDPQSAAISSAYVSAFNDYVRNDLKFGEGMTFRPSVYGAEDFHWDWKHMAPGQRFSRGGTPNVMLDLAVAMKYNPNLKIKLFGGFYDLATPFYTAVYEMEHLPIPESLQKNISYNFFPSGHMVYAHLPSLHQLHDDAAAFIEANDNQGNK